MHVKNLFTWLSSSAIVPNDGGGNGRSAIDEIKALLAESMDKQRGVNIYVAGATLGALVTDIGDDFVVARSREASRIVVRLDRIDAVTMS